MIGSNILKNEILPKIIIENIEGYKIKDRINDPNEEDEEKKVQESKEHKSTIGM